MWAEEVAYLNQSSKIFYHQRYLGEIETNTAELVNKWNGESPTNNDELIKEWDAYFKELLK